MLVLSMLPQASRAAEYYAMIDSFGKRPLNAYIDVSVDNVIGPADVEFVIINPVAGSPTNFTVRTNAEGLASTLSVANLFDLSGGQPLLVRARNQAATPSAAMVHIDSRGAPLTFPLWPANRRSDGSGFSVGRNFSIALGSFRSASLLIANIGGSDQVVDVHVGTRSSDGSGIYSNPRVGPFQIWKVNLSQNEAMSNLVVSSSGPLAVQLMIDDGTKPQAFVVMPDN